VKELLNYVCSQLDQHQIPYMISGSVAMSVYTVPRFTRDIDLVVVLQEQDAAILEAIFSKGFYFHRPSVDEEIRRRGFFNVIDDTSGYKIDFVIRKQEPFRYTEFARKRRDIVYGTEAWVVSVEDLVLSKLIWIQDYQSGQQKMDIEHLIADNELDMAYIQHWITQLNLKTFGLI
jgi:hypothetical protein